MKRIGEGNLCEATSERDVRRGGQAALRLVREVPVPEYGLPQTDVAAAAEKIGSALGLPFRREDPGGGDAFWGCSDEEGAGIVISSNEEYLKGVSQKDLADLDYHSAQSLKFPVSVHARVERELLARLNSAMVRLFAGAAFFRHPLWEDLGAQLVSMAGAASVSFTGVRGRLAELLRHPGLRALRRVEIHEPFDLEPSDTEALRACANLSPIAVIGVGDGPGPSGEEVIRILAGSPVAKGLEELVLYWDTYLEGSPGVREREAEVDRIIGRRICRVDASN